MLSALYELSVKLLLKRDIASISVVAEGVVVTATTASLEWRLPFLLKLSRLHVLFAWEQRFVVLLLPEAKSSSAIWLTTHSLVVLGLFADIWAGFCDCRAMHWHDVFASAATTFSRVAVKFAPKCSSFKRLLGISPVNGNSDVHVVL